MRTEKAGGSSSNFKHLIIDDEIKIMLTAVETVIQKIKEMDLRAIVAITINN